MHLMDPLYHEAINEAIKEAINEAINEAIKMANPVNLNFRILLVKYFYANKM